MTDFNILKTATNDNRILLTEDKDFGEWVFAHKSETLGVILIRYPSLVLVFALFFLAFQLSGLCPLRVG